MENNGTAAAVQARIGLSGFARAVSLLNISGNPYAGWHEFHLLNETHFLKALFFLSCYSMPAAVAHFLYRSNILSNELKNITIGISAIWLFLGALHISGYLTPKRTLLVILNFFTYVTWQYFFGSNHPVEDMFGIIMAYWLILWWVFTEPGMAAALGFRRESLIKDGFTAILTAGVLVTYTSIGFRAYGFHLVYKPWKLLEYTAGSLSGNLFTFIFFFTVWRRLQEKGISQLGNILALLTMLVVLQAPTFTAFMLVGAVKPMIAMVGLVGNTLMFIIIIVFSFKKYHNVLHAIFYLSAIQLLLVMAGILGK
jgi:hypothetical protein